VVGGSWHNEYMLIYLYGPDSYRRQKKLKSILDEYRKKHSALTIERFSMEEKDGVNRIENFLKDQSLFGETKLGVVHDPEEAEGLSPVLKSVLNDKTTTLIVVSEKKMGTGFGFLFKKPALAESFEVLKGAELIAALRHEAAARKISVEEKTLFLLAETYGGDLFAIVNELEKMALGSDFAPHPKDPPFFALIQTLKSRSSLGSRLSALAYLLENEEPAAIFNITAAIADPSLKIKMADYDIAVKSGKLEYEEVLTDLAIGNP